MTLAGLSTFRTVFSSSALFAGSIEPPKGLSPERARQLGLQAYIADGSHGAIANLAAEFGVSRYVVKQCRDAFSAHLETLYTSEPQAGPIVNIPIDREAIKRALILSRADSPLSYRALRRITAYYLGILMGYGTIYNAVSEAEVLARNWLSRQQLSAVECVALDELFCQGRWVMVVIDVRTQTLCGLKVVDSRTEAAWTELLTQLRDNQKLHPQHIVSDAGTGLIAAADEIFPGAYRSHDIFHAKQAMGEALEHLERRAYKSLHEYYETAQARDKARPDKRRSLGQQLRRAQAQADRDITLHDQLLALVRRAFESLEFIDPVNGQLKQGKESAEELAAVAKELTAMNSKRLKKLGTYLKNQHVCLTSYINDLGRKLLAMATNIDELAVVLTAASVYRIDRERSSGFNAHRHANLLQLRNRLLDDLLLLDLTPHRLSHLFISTCQTITQCGRASSIVECFNSIIRKFLQINKRMTEGALMLIAARWTLAPRELGALAGSCPYTELTGIKVHDWLTEIGLKGPTAPKGSHLSILEVDLQSEEVEPVSEESLLLAA